MQLESDYNWPLINAFLDVSICHYRGSIDSRESETPHLIIARHQALSLCGPEPGISDFYTLNEFSSHQGYLETGGVITITNFVQSDLVRISSYS